MTSKQSRRKYLTGIVGTVAFGLAGCTSEGETDGNGNNSSTVTDTRTDEPTETDTDTVTATATAVEATTTGNLDQRVPDADDTSAKAGAQAVETKINESGISATINTKGGGDLRLTYFSTAMDQGETAGEMGTIIGHYAGGVAAGYEYGTMRANAYTTGEELIGEWKVRRSWAKNFVNGEWSKEEYATRVLETLSTP